MNQEMTLGKVLLFIAIWLLYTANIGASFYLPCEYVECPEANCSLDRQELRGCCHVCVQQEREVCGKNLECAAGLICNYRLGIIQHPDVVEGKTGRCEPEACERHRCDYRRYCVVWYLDIGDYFGCLCDKYRCERKYNPVCGYDGITYDSVCHLRREECYYHKFIGLRYMGNCTEATPSAPPTTPPTTIKSKSLLNNLQLPEEEEEQSSPVENSFLQEEEEEVVTECDYYGKKIALKTMVPETSGDPCTYIFCNEYGVTERVIVSGCQGYPPEKYYFEDKFAIEGGWSDWSPWSECEGHCWNATRTRTRECNNPEPKYEGRGCIGPSELVEVCLPESCNFTCEYSDWSEWSACSGTCGEGITTRTRTLLRDVPPLLKVRCAMTETKPCEVGPTCVCQKRFRILDHLYTESGCATVYKHPVYFCGGSCKDKDGERRTCVAKTQMMQLVTQCPGQPYWRYAEYEHVATCRCQVNNTIAVDANN